MKRSIRKNVRSNAKMKKEIALKNAENNLEMIRIKNGLAKKNAQIKGKNVKINVKRKQKAYQ